MGWVMIKSLGNMTRQDRGPAFKTIDPKERLEQIELPPVQAQHRRMWKHHRLSHYRRLVFLVASINLLMLLYGTFAAGWWTSFERALPILANLVVGNIGMAILIRQQLVINLLFKIATSIPTSWPLQVRWLAGKVYHFGGIHSGGTTTGTLWFISFVGIATIAALTGRGFLSTLTLALTYLILGLLIGIIVMAWPPIRAKYHDSFEMTHRFGGWAALLLFWLQTISFVNDGRGDLALGAALLQSFGFWMLSIITVSIILPWLHLRRVPVDIERPSNHAVMVRFNYGVKPFAGSSTTVSRNPLVEWHSFANIPAPDQPGFRLTISRAGDWTGALIDDMPSHLWVKGIPTAGVGNIDKLFKRVVWIATGSGIGPTLPHLLSQEVPARLVWSTRNARETYGDQLVDEILEVEPNALIWDTNAYGRPDLVKLAYEAVVDFDAEAVIVISNQKLTRLVVYEMEARGIPAYGAIWDS